MAEEQELTIIRSPKSVEDPYVRVDRRTAQRDRKTGEGLSFAARGLMLYILSKPPGWKVKHSDLLKEGDIGRDALNTILRELLDKGYVDRLRVRQDDGTFKWIVTVYELPAMNPNYDQCGKSALDDQSGLSTHGKSALDDDSPIKDLARAPVPSEDHKDQETKDVSKRKPPRLQHPAIRLFRKVTKHLPKQASREKVIKALCGTPNEPFLRECYETWINWGYNEWNLNWLFDWYTSGVIPEDTRRSAKAYSHPDNSKTGQTLAAGARVMAEILREEEDERTRQRAS